MSHAHEAQKQEVQEQEHMHEPVARRRAASSTTRPVKPLHRRRGSTSTLEQQQKRENEDERQVSPTSALSRKKVVVRRRKRSDATAVRPRGAADHTLRRVKSEIDSSAMAQLDKELALEGGHHHQQQHHHHYCHHDSLRSKTKEKAESDRKRNQDDEEEGSSSDSSDSASVVEIMSEQEEESEKETQLKEEDLQRLLPPPPPPLVNSKSSPTSSSSSILAEDFSSLKATKEKEKKEQLALELLNEKPAEIWVGILTELLIEQKDVGFDFAVLPDGTLELSGIDHELYREAVPNIDKVADAGDRIAYVEDRSFTPHSERKKEEIMKWLEDLPRPVRVGIEHQVQKKSNLRNRSLRSPSAVQAGVQKRHVRTCELIEPKSAIRKRQKTQESHLRRPPVSFTKAWDWLMHMKDYPVEDQVHKAWAQLHEGSGWSLVSVEACYKTSMRVNPLNLDGSVATEKKSCVVPFDRVRGVHLCHLDTENAGDDHLAELDELNEPAIAFRIQYRFLERKKFFTWLTPRVLIFANPCDDVEGLFTVQNESTPHVFSLAKKALHEVKVSGKSQSVVLSGIAGSGKSRLQSEIVNYLLSTSCSPAAMEQLKIKWVAGQILLQAFGNASTIRSSDNTCFTKLTRFAVNAEGQICNLEFGIFSLNLRRVTRKHSQERNFHVFYQLCNGWKKLKILQKKLGLAKYMEYYILRPDTYEIRVGSKPKDVKSSKFPFTKGSSLQRTVEALKLIGMDNYVQEDLLRMLAALLLLGNLEFEANPEWAERAPPDATGGSSTPATPALTASVPATTTRLASPKSAETLRKASELLQIDQNSLLDAFLFRQPPRNAKDSHPTPLSPMQARDMRDLFLQHLYDLIVSLVLHAVNDMFSEELGKTRKDLWLNVVEHDGFAYGLPDHCSSEAEGFAKPSMISGNMTLTTKKTIPDFAKEQLLSMEALLQNYNSEVLAQMYERELRIHEKSRLEELIGSKLRVQPLQDSLKVVELLGGQPSGILRILDEQSLLHAHQAVQDTDFVQQVITVHDGHRHLKRATFGYSSFRVKHYGGSFLEYDATGMVAENCRAAVSCSTQFIGLFDVKRSQVLALLQKKAQERLAKETYEEEKLRRHVETRTAVQQRRREFLELSEMLEPTGIWFVRCILPNLWMEAGKWEDAQAVRQLEYHGLSHHINLLEQLFPLRMSPEDIRDRFLPIARRFSSELDAKSDVAEILERLLGPSLKANEASKGIGGRWFAVGDIYHFTSKGRMILERCRWRIREKSTIVVQHAFMQLQEMVESAIKIQRFVYQTILDPRYVQAAVHKVMNAIRTFRSRRDFLIIRAAAIRVQSVVRMFLCRHWDIRANRSVLPFQAAFRGFAVRQRLKMVHVCRNQLFGVISSSAAVVRSSFVLQMAVPPRFGKPSKKKRQLVLTAGKQLEVILVDPVHRKVLWTLPWEEESTVAKKLSDESFQDSNFHFQLQTKVGSEIKGLSFCDLLDTSGDQGWTVDINRPQSFQSLVNLPFQKLPERFFGAFLMYGTLLTRQLVHGRGQQHRIAWKERFVVVHRMKMYYFKNEEVDEVFNIQPSTQISAVNSLDGEEQFFIELRFFEQVSGGSAVNSSQSERPAVVEATTTNPATTSFASSSSYEGEAKAGPEAKNGPQEDDFDRTIYLRVGDSPTREKWTQGIAWVIRMAQTASVISALAEEDAANDEFLSPAVYHALALAHIRRFASLTLGQDFGLVSQRRPESVQRRLSKMLSSASADDAMIGRITTASAAAALRNVEGLYHRVQSEVYQARNSASSPDDGDSREIERYRRMMVAKINMGRYDEALSSFYDIADLKEGVCEKYELETRSANLNSLLLFTGSGSPKRKKRKRKHRKGEGALQMDGTEENGLDKEVLDEDEDGKLLKELLENMNMGEYLQVFRANNCATIKQVKLLTHEDLAEFGIDLFTHQEKLIDAFQNYAKIGSTLKQQTKRSSLPLDALYVEEARFEEALHLIGMESYRKQLLESDYRSVEDLLVLSKQRLSKLGLTHEERKGVLSSLAELQSKMSSLASMKETAPEDEVLERVPSGDDIMSLERKLLGSKAVNEGMEIDVKGEEEEEGDDKDKEKDGGDERDKNLSHHRKSSGGVKFADQTGWICKSCGKANVAMVSKCKRCAHVPRSSELRDRLEHVRTVESCGPWMCAVCRRINNYSRILCSNCDSARFKVGLPVDKAHSADKFAIGARVKLVFPDLDLYSVQNGSIGTVAEVLNSDSDAAHQCVVQMEDGKRITVRNEHIRRQQSRSGFQLSRLAFLPKFSFPSSLSPLGGSNSE